MIEIYSTAGKIIDDYRGGGYKEDPHGHDIFIMEFYKTQPSELEKLKKSPEGLIKYYQMAAGISIINEIKRKQEEKAMESHKI